MTRSSIGRKFVKKSNILNPVKSLRYIKCYSVSSTRHVKCPSNFIIYNCLKSAVDREDQEP